MALQNLCPPALIYLLFSLTQVVIDAVKGLYNTAFIKIWVAVIFTILLNYLCDLGLGIISWIIVFIPFILMTLIVAILLLMFGLDPATGKIKIADTNSPNDVINTNKSKNLGIDERERSKKQNEILKKSLLNYSADEQDVSMTTKYFSQTQDINVHKVMVYELSNVLSNIGEQELSIYYKRKALGCIYESSYLDSEKLNKCYSEIYEEIDKLPPDRRNRIKGTINKFIINFKNQ